MKRFMALSGGLLAIIFVSVHYMAVAEPGEKTLAENANQLSDLVKHSLFDRGSYWRCTPQQKWICSSSGCKTVPPTVNVDLDFVNNVYKRCDAKGCDSHLLTATMSGLYTVITLVGKGGTFLKTLNDGSRFVEVASSGTGVFTAFGACLPSK